MSDGGKKNDKEGVEMRDDYSQERNERTQGAKTCSGNSRDHSVSRYRMIYYICMYTSRRTVP